MKLNELLNEELDHTERFARILADANDGLEVYVYIRYATYGIAIDAIVPKGSNKNILGTAGFDYDKWSEWIEDDFSYYDLRDLTQNLSEEQYNAALESFT